MNNDEKQFGNAPVYITAEDGFVADPLSNLFYAHDGWGKQSARTSGRINKRAQAKRKQRKRMAKTSRKRNRKR